MPQLNVVKQLSHSLCQQSQSPWQRQHLKRVSDFESIVVAARQNNYALEEFSANLSQFFIESLSLLHDDFHDTSKPNRTRSLQLQKLYGNAVLPPALLSLRNGYAFGWEHVCPVGTDRETA